MVLSGRVHLVLPGDTTTQKGRGEPYTASESLWSSLYRHQGSTRCGRQGKGGCSDADRSFERTAGAASLTWKPSGFHFIKIFEISPRSPGYRSWQELRSCVPRRRLPSATRYFYLLYLDRVTRPSRGRRRRNTAVLGTCFSISRTGLLQRMLKTSSPLLARQPERHRVSPWPLRL